MTLRHTLMALLIPVLAASTASAATVLDFESGTYSDYDGSFYQQYDEAGFTFTSAAPRGNHIHSDSGDTSLDFHEAGNGTGDNPITMVFSGGAFNVSAFDWSYDDVGATQPRTLTVSGSNGNELVIDLADNGWNNVTTDLFQNVDWVTFDLSGDQTYPTWQDMVSIDNIDTAPAPEPTTLALLGLGAAGIGFARRRRRS